MVSGPTWLEVRVGEQFRDGWSWKDSLETDHEETKCKVQKTRKLHPLEAALRQVVQTVSTSCHSGGGISSVMGASLTLGHTSPMWGPALGRTWQVRHVGFSGRCFICSAARYRQCWFLTHVSARGIWVSGKRIMEELWTPNPKCAPLHLVLWNVLAIFSWWTGASEASLTRRNMPTLSRRPVLPAVGQKEGDTQP